MYIRSYNGLVSNVIDQIKNSNFPKDHLLSGLSEKVTRSFKWRKMLDSKQIMKNMFATENIDRIEILDSNRENEENGGGEFQMEFSAESVGTRTNEGVAQCIEHEIRALEQSRRFPKR